MTRLAAVDLAAVGAFARDLDERTDGDLGSPAMLDALLSLVRADGIEWGTTDLEQGRIVELRHYPSLVVLRGEDPFLTAASERFWSAWPACPVCGPSRQRTRGAFKLSDIPDTSGAHPEHGWCAGFDVAHQMNLFLRPRDATFARHFALSRLPGVDFDERDRQVAELAGVFLTQQIRTVEAYRDARAAVAGFEMGDPDERRSVIVLDRANRIALISHVGRGLLSRYFGWSPWDHRLPAALDAWLAEAAVVERVAHRARSSLAALRRIGPSGELLVRSVIVDGQIVVILDEHPSAPAHVRASLTSREREILDAVGEGLTNSQIADRLGVATSTIAKHLEHIYAKLGVANRAAAVVRAAKRLNA
jgi:DNA-binding CsgD family transcriptional regulator